MRGALGVDAQRDLTCSLISGLTALDARSAGIESLVGIQNLTNLTNLILTDTLISDISALSGLTGLTTLYLQGNSALTDIGTVSGLTSLTYLDFRDSSITDISALSGLTALTNLQLGGNSISDISALSGLTSLGTLQLGGNSITDISELSGLTRLRSLRLDNNSIIVISALSGLRRLRNVGLSNNSGLSNIQPLLDNIGLGAGDTVDLTNTNVSCTDVAALEAEGVTVESDCLVLQPSGLCSAFPDNTIATFADSFLEASVLLSLGLDVQDDLTCGLLSELTFLTANARGIQSLVGIHNLTHRRSHTRGNGSAR